MKLKQSIKRVSFGVVTGCLLVFSGYIVCQPDTFATSQDERIQNIYNSLWVQTGMTTEYVPLTIDKSSTINAYATVGGITIFQGMIDFTKSDDEIALVLGHEIAHVLSHDMTADISDEEWLGKYQISQMEARADKLGAVYIIKAGYDVCKARDMWLRLVKSGGDYLFADHPGLAYRYSQLNFQCSSGL